MKLNQKEKYLNTLKRNIATKLKEIRNDSFDNPVVKARNTWQVASEMLVIMLGDEVHTQWFKNISPLFLKNKILVLQTENTFAAQWINTHYQELVESVLKIQDPALSCFFIAPRNA